MRRLILAAAGFAAISTAVLAANPHFIYANGVVNNDGTLTVSWKEAGLGDTTSVNYLLSADATIVYQCYNRGNNSPQGNPFQLPTQNVTAEGTFTSTRNGQITASLTTPVPDPEPAENAIKCLSGGNRMLCLSSATYENILLSNNLGDSTGVTPDPASASFPAPTKRGGTPDYCTTSL